MQTFHKDTQSEDKQEEVADRKPAKQRYIEQKNHSFIIIKMTKWYHKTIDEASSRQETENWKMGVKK